MMNAPTNNRRRNVTGWIILAVVAAIVVLALVQTYTSCTTGSDGQVCNAVGHSAPTANEYKDYEHAHESAEQRITREAKEAPTPSDETVGSVAARIQAEEREDSAAEAEQ
jgi:hypothetical protein